MTGGGGTLRCWGGIGGGALRGGAPGAPPAAPAGAGAHGGAHRWGQGVLHELFSWGRA